MVRENLGICFISSRSPGKSGNFYLDADYHEFKKKRDLYCDFHAIIISCSRQNFNKISKVVKEICVQVREKARELFFIIWMGTLIQFLV